MVVASAAYISGQRIYDGYYNKIHDYTSKSGVVFTEILTPEYVPERMTDREILWNEVEHVERNNKAQLAKEMNLVRSTIHEHRTRSLEILRKIMEGIADEKDV